MISALGPVNIPVEDKSYKWSKKIAKTRFHTNHAASELYHVSSITAWKSAIFTATIKIHGDYRIGIIEANQFPGRFKKTSTRKITPGL
jgi:hypothetical protein